MSDYQRIRFLIHTWIDHESVQTTLKRALSSENKGASAVGSLLFFDCHGKANIDAYVSLLSTICQSYLARKEDPSDSCQRMLVHRLVRKTMRGRRDVRSLDDELERWVCEQVEQIEYAADDASLPTDLALCRNVALHLGANAFEDFNHDRLYLSFYIERYVRRTPKNALSSSRWRRVKKRCKKGLRNGRLSIEDTAWVLEVSETAVVQMLAQAEVDPSDINALRRHTQFQYPSQRDRAWGPSAAGLEPQAADTGKTVVGIDDKKVVPFKNALKDKVRRGSRRRKKEDHEED